MTVCYSILPNVIPVIIFNNMTKFFCFPFSFWISLMTSRREKPRLKTGQRTDITRPRRERKTVTIMQRKETEDHICE